MFRKSVSGLLLFCSYFLFFALDSFAQLPPPFLRLSFDNKFSVEGTGVSNLKVFEGSPFAGLSKAPAGQFVEGLAGKGFVPAEDLRIEGKGVFPAPEGTLSLWIKPVKYEEDWIGGPLLTPGRIGAFLVAGIRDEASSAQARLQVRLSRHDCCSGFHWFEMWPGQHQEFRTTGPNQPFAIWQDGKWRMLTVVWFKGERRIYFNGVRIQHGVDVARNPSIGGDYITIPAGSKAVDELNVWDAPLTDSQVAALFYSQMPQSGLSGAVQKVPKVAGGIAPGTDSPAWERGVSTRTWTDSYSGMAAESKPYSDEKDILELAHYGSNLYLRYREPMPEEYVVVSTLLGAEGMLRRRVIGRDNDVWQDDCVEVRLTPDGGTTNYVLAAGAGGGLYDARNGDTSFNLGADEWKVNLNESEKYWTVEMKIDLASLSGGNVPAEWGFNVVRTVRQQGYARRQWSFVGGEPEGYGRILLSEAVAVPVSTDMEWLSAQGRLDITVEGASADDVEVAYSVTPLNIMELFPEEKEIDARFGMMDMILRTGRLDDMPEASVEKITLPAGAIDWTGRIDYPATELALAAVVVSGTDGTVLSRRNALISGSEAVSVRLFNLPSRRELVMQVFLASETLAGEDVVANISINEQDGGKEILNAGIRGFGAIMEEKAIDVSDIPSGPYTVSTSVYSGDAMLGRVELNWFKSGDPVWLDNEIGVIKEVPEPWTPIRHEEGRLEVWGREHSFNNSLLPASMKVLGEEILAGPMRLLIRTGDETLDSSQADTPSVTVDSAGVAAGLSGRVEGRQVLVKMEGEFEFDGFAYMAFTIEPVDMDSPVRIDEIVLEVPFKKEYAELYDDSSYNFFNTRSGLIPDEGMSLAGTGTIRVGDTERGLQFYPVFRQMGARSTREPLQFIPDGDNVLMRYIISEGLTLDKPQENVLGFIGTPVRPLDGKRIRMTGHAGPQIPADLQEKGYSTAKYWTAGWSNYAGGTGSEDGYYNYTPGWADGLALSRKGRWEGHRDYDALYLVPGNITSQTPEYALFWREWEGQYVEGLENFVQDLSRYEGAETRPPGRWMSVDWTKKSWQDFYFYSLDKVLAGFARQGVKVGIYVDVTHHHGDPRPYRRWVQRLYQVGRKHSPDGLIIIHMSGDRRMPVWGMVDVLVEGEQYTANWQAYMANNPGITMNDCYPMMLPLDRMRATYTGPMWGPHQVFLSQFWTDRSQGEDVFRQENPGQQPASYVRRFRYITGLMMVHDAPFWGEFYGCGVADNPQAPWIDRARWGYDDTVEFIPYWDSKGMIDTTSTVEGEIVASGWLRPDGSLLIAVLNNTDEDAGVSIKIISENFPVQLRDFSRAVDITSPVPVFKPEASGKDIYGCVDGLIEVDMRARDFRLLILE